MIIEGKIYKMPELVEILGMERHTVKKLINDGRIKAISSKKFEHTLVIGKNLIKYLEGEK